MERRRDGETTTATDATPSNGKPADNGQRQFTADEAQYHGGADPDWSKRDLWQAIEKGEEITYTAHVQIMQPEDADPVKLGFDPFDVTKVWPKKQFPVSPKFSVFFSGTP